MGGLLLEAAPATQSTYQPENNLMGHLVNERTFVSELTADEVAEYRRRTLWLAKTHFGNSHIESFDLGNLIGGYMTAEITTSYIPGQRRIWYYIDKHMVYTQRCGAGEGVRRQAEDYFAAQLNRQREHRQQRVGVTA